MAQRQQSVIDAAAAQLGSPRFWGSLFGRVLAFGIAIGGSAVFIAASLSPLAAIASAAVGALNNEVLDFEPLPESFGLPDERSVVVDRNGVELAILRDTNRMIVTIDEVPEHVQNAIIATEDQEFRNHNGVNWQAIGRAAFGNLSAGEIVGGGSTITQQLVKNLVVGDELSLDRKLREAVYATQLEERLSKDEILERYLNEAYFANRVYGIGTAAEFYFGKTVGELGSDEAAMLAGLLRSPAFNDPIRHPDAAIQRRNIVLGQMQDQGYLEPEEAARLKDRPLRLNITPIPEPENPFFVDYVRYLLLNEERALGETPEDRQRSLFRGGLTITTTLDVRLADLADSAIREFLTDADGPQAAITLVDPKTGELLAIGFGPREYGKGPGQSQVNPAVPHLGDRTGRQTGSSFKAFEIVAALEDGVSPAFTTDTPSPYTPEKYCTGTGWKPGNYSDSGGGVMDMAAATARSSNVYFAQLVDRFTGPEKLAETAQRMGVINTAWEPLAKFNCSNVLGAAEAYPVDMAAGFGTLANNGAHCKTFSIIEIRDRDDRVIGRHDPKCKQVVESGIAARATDLLRGPIERGTASRNGKIGRPAAGKTGTTDNYWNAWFVGYIPQLSAATWMGHTEGNIPMADPRCGGRGITGGCLPTMIWQRFMTDAIDLLELPVEEFPKPPPIPRETVPNVVGMPIEEAEEVLIEAQFTPEPTTKPHWALAGTVFEQTPPGGSSVGGGSVVLLSVSDGTMEPPEVPNLIGMTHEDAVALLNKLFFSPMATLVPVSEESEYGIVIDQDPAPGTRVEPDLGNDPTGLSMGQVEIYVGRERTAGDPPETATAQRRGSSATPSPTETGAPD